MDINRITQSQYINNIKRYYTKPSLVSESNNINKKDSVQLSPVKNYVDNSFLDDDKYSEQWDKLIDLIVGEDLDV